MGAMRWRDQTPTLTLPSKTTTCRHAAPGELTAHTAFHLQVLLAQHNSCFRADFGDHSFKLRLMNR